MQIRPARITDAPAMGAVMVESFLAAHRDHYPADAWQRRIDEWTPAVSAAAWADNLREIDTVRAAGSEPDFCLYVAVDKADTPVGLIYGYAQTDKTTVASKIGEIGALYIKPSAQGHGAGRQLVHAAATHLAAIGMSQLHIGVLAANGDARRFYEAIGGQVVGERTYEEDGVQLFELVYGWPDITLL